MNENRFLIRTVRYAGTAFDTLAAIALVLLFVFGAYKVWDSLETERSGTAIQFAKYKPTESTLGFEELKAINPDVVAWITVYGTNIDYPVVQAEDNWKYLNKSVLGSYSLSGAIYMDWKNQADFSDFNTIIYGHDMTPKVMFGNIKDFLQKEYFETHRYGDLFYKGKHHGVEFFSMVTVDGYDNTFYDPGITGDKNKQAYLDRLKAEAVQSRELEVSVNDHIVLLSSCSPKKTNMRNVLVGRITDTVFEDPFEGETGQAVDAGDVDTFTLLGFLRSLPVWYWIILVLPIVLMAAWIAADRQTKKEEEDGEEREDGSDGTTGSASGECT